MAKLIYLMNVSLDGYVADRAGDFAWSDPTAEMFATILELVRPAGTHLYGRRLYETMAVWETAHLTDDTPPFVAGLRDLEGDFAAVWRATEKVVYSTTLAAPTTSRTRIERAVDADTIRRLKATSTRDLTVGGPHLAATLLAAGLVDDVHAIVHPISVGGGTPFLPLERRIRLDLVNVRRLGALLHLHYRTQPRDR